MFVANPFPLVYSCSYALAQAMSAQLDYLKTTLVTYIVVLFSVVNSLCRRKTIRKLNFSNKTTYIAAACVLAVSEGANFSPSPPFNIIKGRTC